MKKIFTHWLFAFVTLFFITYLGYTNPQVKEILKLKKQVEQAAKKAYLPQMSKDELDDWRKDNPEMYDVMKTLAYEEADEKTKAVEVKLEEIKNAQLNLAAGSSGQLTSAMANLAAAQANILSSVAISQGDLQLQFQQTILDALGLA